MNLYIIIREAAQVDPPISGRQNIETQLGRDPTECTAIVPYRPQTNATLITESESGNQTCTSFPEGGIAAEISIDNCDSSLEGDANLALEEDEAVPVGSDFLYEDEAIEDLINDKYGHLRIETEQRKQELMCTTTSVSGQIWTVRQDIPDYGDQDEDFLELGFRSPDAHIDSLPKRCRSKSEMMLGTRASPRLTPAKRGVSARDESSQIHRTFEALFPVNWKGQ